MNVNHEVVDLPDPQVQPLVHPLDLPEARRPFTVWWWLDWFAHPTVLLALAAALWQIGNPLVIVLLVPTLTLSGAVFARKYYAREAWAFIPRKRQDITRSLPLTWVLAGAVLHALLLGVVVVFGVQWLVRSGASAGVAAYSVGSGMAVWVLMLGGLLKSIADGLSRKQPMGRLAHDVPHIAVVLSTLLYGYGKLSTHYLPGQWRTEDVLTGAAILLAVQMMWWAVHARGSKPVITS